MNKQLNEYMANLVHKAIELALINRDDDDFTLEEIYDLQTIQDYLISDEE
jgi:hypothetical protein